MKSDIIKFYDCIPDFKLVKKMKINNYPWGGDYRPESYVQLFLTERALHVRLVSVENNPKVTKRVNNDKVCEDSCLEFFFMPFPHKSEEYLNFEFNAAGVMLLYRGKDRYNRFMPKYRDSNIFNIKPLKNAECWGIDFLIPSDFLKAEYDSILEKGDSFRCNFYKCGDLTEIPHYGCWSPVKSQEPDFHRPEYFGMITISG